MGGRRAVAAPSCVVRRMASALPAWGSLLEGPTMKVCACVLGVMLAATTSSAPAAALQITFDDLASLGNPLVTTVETHGYRLPGAVLSTLVAPGSTCGGD